MFIEIAPINNDGNTKSKILNDCINHTNYWRQMSDRNLSTFVHECSHAVHADIRNDKVKIIKTKVGYLPIPDPDFNRPKMGVGENGFYMLNNKAYKCKEPPIKKSQVAPYVHSQLRGFRFKTYITGQTAWDNQPLYVLDEWSAYLNGTECAIELASMNDMANKGTDISSGPVEFLMYSMGLVMAVRKLSPKWFDEEPDFMKFCSYQATRAVKLATEANKIFPWDTTSKYLDAWEGPICKEYRDLLGDFKPLNLEDFAQG